MKATLIRHTRIADKQIMGTLLLSRVTAGDMVPEVEVLHSLEIDWRENRRSVSCIPEGLYLCRRTFSPRFRQMLYLLEDVPDRSGIRIHVANFYGQLNGCIALGTEWRHINGDRIPDLVFSRQAINRFHDFARDEDFFLNIINAY